MVMSVKEIDQLLEQWEMNVRDLHRRVILAPTPRERERWHAGTPSGCWPKVGRHRPRRRHWDGIPTP